MTDPKNKRGLPEKIKTLARQHGIDLTDDPELLKIIEDVNIDRKLPDEVYALISELVMRLYSHKDQWKSSP
ncbi:hypothetical protein ACFL67_02355 [candidate division KSB1 bacterium]